MQALIYLNQLHLKQYPYARALDDGISWSSRNISLICRISNKICCCFSLASSTIMISEFNVSLMDFKFDAIVDFGGNKVVNNESRTEEFARGIRMLVGGDI